MAYSKKIKMEDIILIDNIRDENREIDGLMQNIDKIGQIQPILVKSDNNGKFILIDGRRRYLAHLNLGLDEIDAFIKDDLENIEVAQFSANLQRKNLSHVEESKIVFKLSEEWKRQGRSQADLSDYLGKKGTWWYPDQILDICESIINPKDKKIRKNERKGGRAYERTDHEIKEKVIYEPKKTGHFEIIVSMNPLLIKIQFADKTVREETVAMLKKMGGEVI